MRLITSNKTRIFSNVVSQLFESQGKTIRLSYTYYQRLFAQRVSTHLNM